MSASVLSPYLMFNGTCRDAMEFYKSCLGGILTMQTFGEAPMPASESLKDKIVHASLDNGTLSFMASDTTPDREVTTGSNVHLSIVGDDDAALKEMFQKLSDGGQVTMPLEKQFWGDVFGTLIDKFGVQWMFNISQK